MCSILIDRTSCSISQKNHDQQTAMDLAEENGHRMLADELRHRLKYDQSAEKQIQLENATIVRLVVKKRNISHHDASNQVEEMDLNTDLNRQELSMHQVNRLFDEKEISPSSKTTETTTTSHSKNSSSIEDNILMHSLDSLNLRSRQRRRSILPKQTYAPWLKMTNTSPEEFRVEIQ
jgi:hypothetical protein